MKTNYKYWRNKIILNVDKNEKHWKNIKLIENLSSYYNLNKTFKWIHCVRCTFKHSNEYKWNKKCKKKEI